MHARNEKRGPTTPLSLSKLQNKRKFHPKSDLAEANSPLMLHSMASTTTEYQKELLEAKYRTWLAENELARYKEVLAFLELERELAS